MSIKNRNILTTLLSSILLLGGCAGIDVQRDTVKPNGYTKWSDSFWYGLTYSFQPAGIRYLQPDNFIVVYSDSGGVVTSEHRILPATDKKLSAQPYSYFANLNFLATDGDAGLKFEDGMLLSTKFSADQTAIPAAIITAAGALAEQAIAAGVAGAGAGAGALFDSQLDESVYVPSIYVFRLRSTKEGFVLVGNEGYSLKFAAE